MVSVWRGIRCTCLSVALVAGSSAANAVTVFVDHLTYTLNGSTAFQDDFGRVNLLPPPNFVGGNIANYFTLGTPVMTGNGKVLMSTDNGAPSFSANNIPTITTRIRLSNNIDHTVNTGIRPGTTFGASVLFDLPSGFGLGEGFTLRLAEFNPSATLTRGLAIRVGANNAGIRNIAFRTEDFLADSIANVSTNPFSPPANATQMLLSLDRLSAGGQVTASFGFLDSQGADIGSMTNMTGGIVPFAYGSERMRIDVLVSTTVIPVPGSLMLLMSGIAVAGMAARKRSRKTDAGLR
jgi:hypothetical protein